MATLKLDRRRANKSGKFPIKVLVGESTDIMLSTDMYASDEEWDDASERYVGKNAKHVNDLLSMILSRVNTRIIDLKIERRWANLTTKQIRASLSACTSSDKPQKMAGSVGEVFDEVIGSKKGRTAELYKDTLRRLQLFCEPDSLDFDRINRLWLERFCSAMGDLAVNTRAIHLRNLRCVCNYAIDMGVTNTYPFRRWHIPTEDTRMRVMPLEQWRRMAQVELTEQYAEYRDMYLLTFYLVGINIVDLARLTYDSVVDGRLLYRRSKTGRLYSIRIEPEAEEIIKRYKGKRHLLRCFDRYENYKDYAQHLNNGLRKIGERGADGKMVPISTEVTTYWARYSWATYAAQIDIPKDTISEALGHSYGNKITAVYIEYDKSKIDAANRRVIDWVIYGIR